jgi:hypothetical protein
MLEIYALYLLSIFYQCAMFIFKPFEKQSDNHLEIYNEICISIVLFFFIFSTDIVSNENVRLVAGYGIVTNLIVNLVVNFTIFFYNAYHVLKPKLKKFWTSYI